MLIYGHDRVSAIGPEKQSGGLSAVTRERSQFGKRRVIFSNNLGLGLWFENEWVLLCSAS